MTEEEVAELAKKVKPPYSEARAWLDERIEQGDVENLVQVVELLDQHPEKYGMTTWLARRVCDSILYSLSMYKQEGFADAALRLACSVRPPRRVSSWLAYWQPVETLEALFVNYGEAPVYQEELACVLQTMVLLGRLPEPLSSAIASFHQRLVEQKHPLSWLPLYLPYEEPLETGEVRYDRNNFRKEEVVTKVEVTEASQLGPVLRFSEKTTPEEARAVGGVVCDWGATKAKVEARVFETTRFLQTHEMTVETLLALELDCLEGRTAEEVIFWLCPSTVAMIKLRDAAETQNSEYNPYGFRWCAAYSRLERWKTIAALVGCAPEASFPEVLEQMRSCRGWWWIDTIKHDWFMHIGWDFGLMVLRPSGDTLAILAATGDEG
jgi:hypothetical protein